jgi:autophagy-related protein 13
VHLLKTAPSLREGLQSDAAAVVPQEPSSVQKVVTEEHGSIASSSTPVTATDALEELKKYREVKESILNRGKTQVSGTNLGEKLTDGEP